MVEVASLSRRGKLQTIDALLQQCETLARKPEIVGGPDGGSQPSRERVTRVCVENLAFAPSWAAALGQTGSRADLAVNIQLLRALRERIWNDRPTELNSEERKLVTLRSQLFAWGDMLADIANGSRVEWFAPDDVKHFVQALPTMLKAARAVLGDRPSVAATFALVEDRIDETSFSHSIDRTEGWRAGWGLITIAYMLADYTGDPLHLWGFRMVSLAPLRRTRREMSYDQVECPECGFDRALDEGRPDRRFDAGQWRCEECHLIGYFPKGGIPRGTVWDDEDDDEQAVANEVFAAAENDPDPLLGESTFTIDLAWMTDASLRAIAQQDFRDLVRCISAGAHKPALFSAGSAAEAMLLDVLQRNEPLAKSYMTKPEHWPDRLSLEMMIQIAHAERLLTDSLKATASAVQRHRDLVHPNRVRASVITVDALTARVLAHAALVVARDLKEAAGDGRVAIFVGKKLGAT